MHPTAPIKNLTEMAARRSLIAQLGGKGTPYQDEMPLDLERLASIPDDEIRKWTDEYIVWRGNLLLTIAHIQSIAGQPPIFTLS